MRHDTLCDFLECLRGFGGHDIGAIELSRLSGKERAFCGSLFAKSGATRMRIGKGYYYKVSEVIAYIEKLLENGQCDMRVPPVRKTIKVPCPSFETARVKSVHFCKELRARGVETFTSSQLSGATDLHRDALAKLLVPVSRIKGATTVMYEVDSFLGLYARPGELSPDVCKICGSLPERVELMSVSGVRCSNIACGQHLRTFLTNDWVKYGSKKVP